jgi:hypothetical protein
LWRVRMDICWIDFDQLTVYEAGALIVTWLAYPDGNEDLRGGVHAALCACVIRATAEDNPEWANAPQTLKPIYALRTETEIDRSLRQLQRRLRDRMVAARMAYPFLHEVNFGQAPKLPPGVRRFSINAMSELVLQDAGQSDPENVETRVWRPSLPVIHLATAVHGFLHLSEGAADPPSIGSLLCHREVIEYVVRNAEACEALLGKSQKLRVNPDRLIRFRLSGG